MGKMRSLTSDEIIVQFFFAKKISRTHNLPEIRNVVFMGMGEPADNAENVVRATHILTTRELFQLSAMKVTGTYVLRVSNYRGYDPFLISSSSYVSSSIPQYLQ
jgi:adenine C2-methylase RlmN of 23S rRNA A2503 and tRNA A37